VNWKIRENKLFLRSCGVLS